MNKYVKRFLKYTGIIIATIIVLMLGLYLYLRFSRTTECPDFNKGYFVWLPYNEQQEVVFTDGKNDKVFIVETVDVHHTDYYMNDAKCGCCEDQMRVVLMSEGEKIEMTYDNHDNPDSCMGENFTVSMNNAYLSNNNLGITPAGKTFNVENKVFFEKDKGLIQFQQKGKIWKLKKLNKKGDDPEIKDGAGC